MGINDRVAARVATFKGQKSGQSLESTTIEDSSSTVNMVLKEGQIAKIPGGTIYAEILGSESGGITSLTRFKNLTIAQRNFSIAAEDSEGSATFTTLTSALTSNNRMQYANWRDRAFMVNGVDAKFLLSRGDGELSSLYEFDNISLSPPQLDGNLVAAGTTTAYGGTSDGYSACPFLVKANGAGNLGNTRSYYYLLTFYDNNTNSESPGWGATITENGMYELTTASILGPKTYFVAFNTGVIVAADSIAFKFSSSGTSMGLGAYLQAQRLLQPRITHFSFYRVDYASGTSATLALSEFRRVPLVDASSSSNGQDIIEIDRFLTDARDFIDNTAYASLPVTSPPENNYPLPTIKRFQDTYDYWYNFGKQINGVAGTGYANLVSQPFSVGENRSQTHAKFFRDQLFCIGSRSDGVDFDLTDFSAVGGSNRGNIALFGMGQFAYSDILHGSEVYQPDYFPYIWEVGRGDGQTAVGLGVLGDTALLVFKNKSTYYLSGSSPDNFTLRIMDTQKGCINEGTIQETPNGVICLDRAGFVLFNKIGQGEKISKDIQDIIDNIQTQYANTFYSWYDPEQMRYYCALVVGSGATTPNLTLCLDLDSGGWTTIQGTEGLSRVMDTNSSGASVDIMGSATNGRLTSFADETQVLFNDQVIESSWTSGTINFQDDQHKKKVQWLYIRALSKETWTVDIEIIPDYDESRKFVIEDWNVLASQSEWYSSDLATDGSLIWDDGTWASEGLVKTISKIPIKCIGYSFQVRIINKESNPERYGFILQSVSIEGTRLGR